MRIINVVKIKNNSLDSIISFPVWEEQLSDDVTFEAEKCFIQNINNELETYLTSDEEYDHIEDKYFEHQSGKFSVYMRNSNT